jgi:hypothetical protein
MVAALRGGTRRLEIAAMKGPVLEAPGDVDGGERKPMMEG